MSTKFIHVRDPLSQFGGCTVAYDVVQENDGSIAKIVYAVSVCHKKDRYDKAKGRVVSEGRLTCRRGNKVRVIAPNPEGGSITDQIMNDAYHLSDAEFRALV